MKTWEANVYVRNGTSRIPHTVRVQAASSFSAQQMLNAQYGSANVISVPYEVKGGSGKFDPRGYLEKY